MRRRDCGSLLALAVGVLSVAAGAEPWSDSLQRCAREADEHLRLACFDALVKSLPQQKIDQFGMTAAIAKQHELSAPPPPLIDPEVLDSKITALGQGPHGEYIFTLDNGQIWAEQEARPGVHFSVGDTVQIKHGAMSSLWLSASDHRMTRVRRIS